MRRQVALKLLKSGLDTHEISTRFLAERQALALMDHPGIARIFDGGTTQSGSPWFAMEYVDGIPITQYVQSRNLPLPERLELFVEVCHAVQHAHQKAVVHRDLKPNNVLVTEVDGRAAPKVIDFGIAKAIETSLTAQTLHTRSGQAMGTPAAMAPEQIRAAADVDTRADVYSLGVLLYEMLTGTQPYASAQGTLPAVDELLQEVQHRDPPLPSTRLKAGGALVRAKDLRGDLDWIVMRCLEKDRERRYDSVALLANDIQRHLSGDPVLAGPPTLSYRLSKLTKRYRAALGVALALMVLLAGGVIASQMQARRALRAEASAKEESRKANLELERFESIANLLEQMLMSLRPEVAQGKDVELLLVMLEQAREQMDRKTPSPEVEATVRRVVGGAYQSIARFEEAEMELQRTLELRREVLGGAHPDTLQSLEELGALYLTWGKLEQGLPFVEQALVGRREHLGPEHEDTMQSRSTLAAAHNKLSRFEESVVELRSLRSWHEERYGLRDRRTLLVINNLANALQHLGQTDEALDLYRRLVDWQTDLHGPDSPLTLMALGNLGGLYSQLDRQEEALPILERSLDSKRRILPPGHLSRLVAYSNLARVHRQLGHHDRAEELFDAALAEGLAAHGPGQRHIQILQLNRADLFLDTDRREQALALLTDLLPHVEASEAPDSPLLQAVRARLERARE